MLLLLMSLMVCNAARLYLYNTDSKFIPAGCAAICNTTTNCFDSYQKVLKCPNTVYVIFENNPPDGCELSDFSCNNNSYISFGLDPKFSIIKNTIMKLQGLDNHLLIQNNNLCCNNNNMEYFVISPL